MSTSIKCTTWTENGAIKMPASKRAEIDAFYRKYADRNIEVKFSLLPKRSTQSNRYYWGVVIPLVTEAMNELGNTFTHESCHEFCKKRFNPIDVVGIGGEVLDVVAGSTTELNNEQFHEEYIGKIKQFAAEYLGCVIPDAGQQSTIFAEYSNELKAIIIQ